LLINLYLFSSIAMASLIWVMQLIHYPSFNYIEDFRFKRFSAFHQFFISILVMPLMLIELSVSSIYLYEEGSRFWLVQVLFLMLIWLVTGLISGPTHKKLLDHGKNEELIDRLIKTNWIRTIAWSFKLGFFYVQF